MKRKNLYWILSLAVLAACTASLKEQEEQSAARVATAEQTSALIPGEVIIQVSEDLAEQLAEGGAQTKSVALNAVFDGLGVTRIERLYPDAGEWEPRHRAAGLHRWFRVIYDPAAQPATKAATDFSVVDGVLYAQPQRRARSTAYFNDPLAPQQWALYNDGTVPEGDYTTPGGSYKAGCDINVEAVWDNYTAGTSDVIVGVIDEGVQMDHPDLAAITIPGGANGSKSFVTNYPGYTIYPDDHGTHVAGIIAAVNNNEEGVSGIAGGGNGKGGVRILACPFLHENPDDPEHPFQGSAYNAMVWAADHGAVIAQNSWGNVYSSQEEAMADNVGAMGPAIDYFIQYAGCDADGNQLPDSPMKGGVVIFAAGNETRQIGWPAAYEPVIAVGSVSAQFTRAYYSNYGDWVDICAPGGDAHQQTRILSTVKDSKYGMMQGTSMACPMVSGVAALIVSYFGGQGFTNEMLKERLLGGANATKVSSALEIGPLVDAMGAFTHSGAYPPEPASGVTVSAKSNFITANWKVTADVDDGKAYGYLFVAAQDAETLRRLSPRKLPSSVQSTTVEVGTRSVGDDISVTLGGFEFETAYEVAVFAYDYAGNYSSLSDIVSVTTGKNNPPKVETDYKGDYKVKPFLSLSVNYSVSDPDGHSYTVKVDPASDAFTYAMNDGVVQVKIFGNRAPHGVYTAHIVATDEFGAETDYPVEYEILENHAPKVVAEMDNLQFGTVGASQTLDMTQYIQDEDGETLTYSVTMTEQNVAHLNPNANSLILTTLGYGLTSVTVTATDACKASCSVSFMILVRNESRPVDLYPVPVTTTLNIRPGTEGQIAVSVSNKAGATVWSGSGAAGPFAPMTVDLSGQAGGIYYVRVEGAGINDTYTIAKK